MKEFDGPHLSAGTSLCTAGNTFISHVVSLGDRQPLNFFNFLLKYFLRKYSFGVYGDSVCMCVPPVNLQCCSAHLNQ